MSGKITYNRGNIAKYQSRNPLKRKLIARFDLRMLQLLKQITSENSHMFSGKVVSLLDAGCGEGFIAEQIRQCFPKWNITGVDGAEEAVLFARKHAKGVDFKVGNLYSLNFSDRAFDIVVCSEVLEHLDDPGKALKELNRVSKSLLLLTVPHEPWFRLGNLFALHNVFRLGNPVDHVNHWSYSEFQKFTKEQLSGFECKYETSFPWSICLAVRKR
jgi:ubiquinone/menaquinone biosynthesis C-methylase UbiE